MPSSSIETVAYALLSRDGDVIPTPPPSDHPPPLTPSGILSRLHLDFSRKTLLYLRLLAFFVLEAGYIILAAFCLVKPIPLKFPFHFADAAVKGGFSVIFNVWQILAISMAGGLALDVFSREWSARLEKLSPGMSGRPPADVPAGIDRVSTITSGLLNRIHHLSLGKSTGTFKLAFLVSLLFLALRPLGSGTINVGTTLVKESKTVPIGKLIRPLDNTQNRLIIATLMRSQLIIQLEVAERSAFGFKPPPTMLFPVPKVDLTSFNGTIEYDSDVVEFHFDCHWEAPQILNISGQLFIGAAGQQWSFAQLPVEDQVKVGSSITPLGFQNVSVFEEVSTVAVMFAGGNSSFPDLRFNPPVPFGIDLESLPTTFIAPGLSLGSGLYYAPLASVLACNPHARITGGRIRVTNDGNLTVIAYGETLSSNIPRSAANLILSGTLTTSLYPDDLTKANGVGSIASTMFMSNTSTIDWNDAYGIPPLNLSLINENMDAFTLLAAKAHMDGFRRVGFSLNIDFELDSVSAMKRSPALALVASKKFFCATVVFVAIGTGLLFVICQAGLTEKRDLFDLEHVVAVLRGSGRRVESEGMASRSTIEVGKTTPVRLNLEGQEQAAEGITEGACREEGSDQGKQDDQTVEMKTGRRQIKRGVIK